MKEMILNFLTSPWPWYVGGPLIGAVVILILRVERKPLGVSTSFEQLCALPLSRGEVRQKMLKDPWQLWFVLGMIFGGFILYPGIFFPDQIEISEATKTLLRKEGLTDLSGFVPGELYNFSIRNSLVLGAGGVLIGFGSRYAGGCTAGHSIMGIAQLAPSSILATVGFFAGGLLSSYLIIPSLIAI